MFWFVDCKILYEWIIRISCKEIFDLKDYVCGSIILKLGGMGGILLVLELEIKFFILDVYCGFYNDEIKNIIRIMC